MNPQAKEFKPTENMLSPFEYTGYVPSVLETMYFDELEKQFVKNNPWIFEDDKNVIKIQTKNKSFDVRTRSV